MTASSFIYAQENNFISYDQPLVGSTLRFKMVPIQGGDFLLGSAENYHCAFLDECL